MDAHPKSVDAGYSPAISIELVLHGERYEVASLSPGRLLLRDARIAPPGRGIVTVSVAGNPTRFLVDLTDGILPDQKAQSFRSADSTLESPEALELGRSVA
jgi:hypothetical protein